MKGSLTKIDNQTCALYRWEDGSSFRQYVLSTPESRAICNDPRVVGLQYTANLRRACAGALQALPNDLPYSMSESSTTVFHILRGGLNFGLREALGDAYGWNKHPSAFISAQRARQTANPEEWYITENAYQKVMLPEIGAIVFGDVVATGTSLNFALHRLLHLCAEEKKQISSMLFFTIGGRRSTEILSEVDAFCRKQFPLYRGAAVVYLEGCFDVAQEHSKLSVMYTGTDLLRSNSVLPPEFIESQYEDPAYALERCTIYDAGSRAFHLPEYAEDVLDYWEKTLKLAKAGMTYEKLLRERFPELAAERFGKQDLTKLCERQLERLRGLLQ